MAFEGSVQDKFKLSDIVNKSYIQFTVDEIKTETETNNILNDLLLYLTERGEYSFVRRLLENGASVNSRNKDCLTPLHISIQKGHNDIFELLLSHCADLAAISRRDICPIYTATEYDRPQMLRRILELDPSQISQRDSYNSLPIHVAAFKGHLQCLEILLDSSDECGINTGNLFGFTPLHFAVQNQKRDAVQLLLKRGANPNVENLFGYRPLHLSVVTGDLGIAKDLIAGDAAIDAAAENKVTPLFLACCHGREDVAKYLLQKRANRNSRGPGGNTSLHAACSGKHLEIVEMLLDNKVEVNSKNDRRESPLHISAFNGSVQISKLLIKNHCDVDGVGPEGDTPLHSAIRSGQKEIVQLLIEAGAKTDIPNSKGETPSDLLRDSNLTDIKLKSDVSSSNLKQYSNFEKENLFEAIKKDNIENFLQIIKPNYDLNITNEFNSTLSHSAIDNKNLIFLKSLLNFNVDLNVKDKNGRTPLALILHDAEFWFKNDEKTCKEVLQKIIESTEDLNVQNEDGDTVLHLIILLKNLELLDNLIELKIDMNIKNNKNKTPFDLVLENSEFWFKNDNEVKLKFMKTILNSLEDINSRYEYGESTVLHFASECDNVELIHFVFERGALLNVGNRNGSTPLHRSSFNNCLNASEALINLGADINQKANGGLQPIHLAAFRGHVPIVDLLIRKRANVNSKDNAGNQPLNWAALNGHTEVVKLLVDGGTEQ